MVAPIYTLKNRVNTYHFKREMKEIKNLNLYNILGHKWISEVGNS